MTSLHLALAIGAWLALVNGLAFRSFAHDKDLARRAMSRTPENALLQWVWLGGGLGAWAAMRVFRHKTRKQPFLGRFRLIVGFQLLAAFEGLLWWIATG